MNEAAARETVLVRAIETTDAGRAVWSDADRAWATRAAAEITGADAAPDVFVARRASLAAALEAARTAASRGAVVLLSPACASFDMFDNYEHRSRVFREAIEQTSGSSGRS